MDKSEGKIHGFSISKEKGEYTKVKGPSEDATRALAAELRAQRQSVYQPHGTGDKRRVGPFYHEGDAFETDAPEGTVVSVINWLKKSEKSK